VFAKLTKKCNSIKVLNARCCSLL